MIRSVELEKSVCMSPSCGAVSDGLHERCPDCGARAIPRSHARRLGWVGAAGGAAILAFMAWLLWYMVPLLRAGGADVDGARFDATEGETILIVAILAMVTALGLGFLVAGLDQALRGRRNTRVLKLILVLTAVLLTIGLLIRRGLIA